MQKVGDVRCIERSKTVLYAKYNIRDRTRDPAGYLSRRRVAKAQTSL